MRHVTIQPPLLSQEADLALGVTPDEGDDDSFLLSTLKPIDAAELDARECFFQGGKYRELEHNPC